MIQRIQSLYLLLTTVLAVLFLTGTILEFSSPSGLSEMTAFDISNTVTGSEFYMILTILMLVIPLLSFSIIFLYKKRKTQLKLTLLLIFLIIAVIAGVAFFAVMSVQSGDTEIVPGYAIVLPLLMLISAVLAYRGIQRDENIVRSYDRLR